jgi:hypothetical protein
LLFKTADPKGTATKEKTMKYETGNSQLLIDYRKKLVEAFKLGEDIKQVYGIVPPKVLLRDERVSDGKIFSGRIGLDVAGTGEYLGR